MSVDTNKNPAVDENKESFAEVALRLGGASEDEARRTGVLDSADDQVEDLFAPEYQTVNSPAHRAVWDKEVPTSLFKCTAAKDDPEVEKIIQASIDVIRGHQRAGTLHDEHKKITQQVLDDLGKVGYWGMLVDKKYGGAGSSMRQFAKMITRISVIDPTIAGLSSVHGCIGAVDPVRGFGNAEQKERILPKLADGTRLSAFALTEPGAGSDLTALRTTAKLDGDEYVVNGEKLFITNATLGRTIGLVCKVDGKPSVLIVDLPDQESESFQINKYGLWALKHTYNQGLVFKDFRVPKENLLVPARGDGLTIAYHGLNLGRVALCANAAGTMRGMLADMLPWAEYRVTYGQAIEKRELVQRRIGKLAGMIVACDAVSQWCAGLIDQGYRGEMECIVAKIFGSEIQKEAAIELYMKTHGGRSFLHGHPFGDNVHEFLAPCIYEGEGEVLSMAFFKSVVKNHGKVFFEAIGRTLHELGVREPKTPAHFWALRKPFAAYAKWLSGRKLSGGSWTALPVMPKELRDHATYAQRVLSQSGLKISAAMRTHQLKLADRQCRMTELSWEVQNALVILITSLYAAESKDEIVRSAADGICRELRRRITGAKPSDRDYRQITDLGKKIAENGWKELEGIQTPEIMMQYEQE
jgi:alkylation response protein AidB-like acyl-CoA dehydrogenase